MPAPACHAHVSVTSERSWCGSWRRTRAASDIPRQHTFQSLPSGGTSGRQEGEARAAEQYARTVTGVQPTVAAHTTAPGLGHHLPHLHSYKIKAIHYERWIPLANTQYCSVYILILLCQFSLLGHTSLDKPLSINVFVPNAEIYFFIIIWFLRVEQTLQQQYIKQYFMYLVISPVICFLEKNKQRTGCN